MDYTKKIILALDSKELNENISLIDELVPPIEIVKIGSLWNQLLLAKLAQHVSHFLHLFPPKVSF